MENRPDPDALLRRVRAEEAEQTRGKIPALLQPHRHLGLGVGVLGHGVHLIEQQLRLVRHQRLDGRVRAHLEPSRPRLGAQDAAQPRAAVRPRWRR